MSAIEGGFSRRDNGHTVSGAALALAVITVVVSSDSRLVDSRSVCDGTAEAVTGEGHDGDREMLRLWKDLGGVNKYLGEGRARGI